MHNSVKVHLYGEYDIDFLIDKLYEHGFDDSILGIGTKDVIAIDFGRPRDFQDAFNAIVFAIPSENLVSVQKC